MNDSPQSAPSGEQPPVREDYRIALLRKVAEAVKSVGSLAEWHVHISVLPRAGQNLAFMYAVEPDSVREAAERHGTSAQEIRLWDTIASKAREVASREELTALESELHTRSQEPPQWTYAQREDPLAYVEAKSFVDLDDQRLKIRVMGGRAENQLEIDFTKTPVEIVSLAASLLRWASDGMEVLSREGLKPEQFVHLASLAKALEELEQETEKLGSAMK